MTTSPRRWDDGIAWHTEQVTAASDEAISVALAQKFTRDPNGEVEAELFRIWAGAARRMAERHTQRAIGSQSWTLVLSAFPWDYIRVPMPPLVEVTDIVYVDADGDEQTMAASPEEFQVIAPSGPQAQCARIYPLYGESWPATRDQPDAVRVHFTCGYTIGEAVETDVPDDIVSGMLLVLGEFYKQRSESVQLPNNTSALIRAADLWQGYRVY